MSPKAIHLRKNQSRPRHGFTLVETAIATVMVGGLLVVAMNMVGASSITQSRYAEREQALLLAEDLLQEVMTLPYEDPNDTVTFGIEVGEDLAVRTTLDDSDDYHGYSEAPPADADGNAIPGAENFTRSVAVQWVEADDLESVAASETGVKRVIVSIRRGGRSIMNLRAYQTQNWPDATEMTETLP